MKITQLTSEVTAPYQDEAEEELLQLFSSQPNLTEQACQNYLLEHRSFPLEYHLSLQRELLLDWYSFEGKRVLEIGAGCGALTGLLSRTAEHVYANELMPRRAEILAARYTDRPNIELLVGPLSALPTNLKVDVIVVVGVLEYAGTFTSSDHKDQNPYQQFLLNVSSLLKPKGDLLLAIENKIGLKYFSGIAEDHSAKIFDGMNDYPQGGPAKTFSKHELTSMLNGSGFKKLEWYYPFPDYKFPKIVLSQAGMASLLSEIGYHSVAQTSHSHTTDIDLFPLLPVSRAAGEEGILTSLAPSFLVKAQL